MERGGGGSGSESLEQLLEHERGYVRISFSLYRASKKNSQVFGVEMSFVPRGGVGGGWRRDFRGGKVLILGIFRLGEGNEYLFVADGR